MKKFASLLAILVPLLVCAQVPPPPAATQAEVNAGALHNKYVAPDTLKNWSGVGGINSYTLPPATTNSLGGVIPDGTTITVDGTGKISTVSNVTSFTNTLTSAGIIYTNFVSFTPSDISVFFLCITNDTQSQWTVGDLIKYPCLTITNQFTTTGGSFISTNNIVGFSFVFAPVGNESKYNFSQKFGGSASGGVTSFNNFKLVTRVTSGSSSSGGGSSGGSTNLLQSQLDKIALAFTNSLVSVSNSVTYIISYNTTHLIVSGGTSAGDYFYSNNVTTGGSGVAWFTNSTATLLVSSNLLAVRSISLLSGGVQLWKMQPIGAVFGSGSGIPTNNQVFPLPWLQGTNFTAVGGSGATPSLYAATNTTSFFYTNVYSYIMPYKLSQVAVVHTNNTFDYNGQHYVVTNSTTAAIQEAMNALQNNPNLASYVPGGGMVLLDTGVFYTTTTINVPNINNSITLNGAGMISSVICCTTSNTVISDFGGQSHYFGLHDLCIAENTNACVPMVTSGAGRGDVERVWFTYWGSQTNAVNGLAPPSFNDGATPHNLVGLEVLETQGDLFAVRDCQFTYVIGLSYFADHGDIEQNTYEFAGVDQFCATNNWPQNNPFAMGCSVYLGVNNPNNDNSVTVKGEHFVGNVSAAYYIDSMAGNGVGLTIDSPELEVNNEAAIVALTKTNSIGNSFLVDVVNPQFSNNSLSTNYSIWTTNNYTATAAGLRGIFPQELNRVPILYYASLTPATWNTNFSTGNQALLIPIVPAFPSYVGINYLPVSIFTNALSAADAVYFTAFTPSNFVINNIGLSTSTLNIKIVTRPDF